MTFNFFRSNPSFRLSSSITAADVSLDQSMTDVAIQLIKGEGGSEWRGYFIDVFKNEPNFLKNVDPKYQEDLIAVLNHQQAIKP